MPKRRGRTCVRLAVLVVMLLLPGCQNSITVPVLPGVMVELTANPSNISATPCPPSACGAGSDEVEAITTMVLRETGGGSATLEGFTVAVRRDSDNAILLDTTVGIGAGTRLTFRQTASVPFAVHFPRAQAGSAMTLTATANLRDDKGLLPVYASVTLPVTPAGG